MGYLIPFVLWKDEPKHRTKNWINILKIRLKLHFPNRCSTIIRNEAHVRLASSTWYVGRAVCLCSKYACAGLMLSLVVCFIEVIVLKNLESIKLESALISNIVVNYIFSLVSVGIIYLMGRFASTRIEKFLHYQRQREVVHVLETAWSAFRERPDLLNPPFKEYAEFVSTHDRDRKQD
jgi:hypothetical protein